MYLMKKNVDFIKPIETLNGTTMEEEVQSTSYSFTTKQSFTRSINETQKALQLVQEKKKWSDWKISQKKFKLRICDKRKRVVERINILMMKRWNGSKIDPTSPTWIQAGGAMYTLANLMVNVNTNKSVFCNG